MRGVTKNGLGWGCWERGFPFGVEMALTAGVVTLSHYFLPMAF